MTLEERITALAQAVAGQFNAIGTGGDGFIGVLQDAVAELTYEVAIAKNQSVLELSKGFAITYDDASGIDAGSSSGYSHNATSEMVENVSTLSTAFTKAETYWGLPAYTTIQEFSPAQMPGAGSAIRFKFSGNSSGSHTIDDVFVSQQAASGDAWDSHSDITRVTFNGGSNGITIGVGEEVWSDWITYAVDDTKTHLVSTYVSSGSVPYRSDGAHTVYYKAGNEASTEDRSGYSSAGYLCGPFEMEVETAPQEMDLVSPAYQAPSVPTEAAFTMKLVNPDGGILNSHIVAQVSRDDGVTWDSATLVDKRTIGTTTVCGGSVDLSGQPSGSLVRSRVRAIVPTEPQNAKSVVFDADDNHGNGSLIGVRAIKFYLDGALVSMPSSSFTAYSTTEYNSNFTPTQAFDTTESDTGSHTGGWLGANGTTTNQRLIIVANTAFDFDEIRIENYHDSGAQTDRGLNNVKVTLSSDAITDTTFDASVSNGTELSDTAWPEHAASDASDEQGVFTAAVGDPNFSKVALLLPFDGTDGATSTVDESDNAHAITFNGDAQIDTAQSKFGGASLSLDGTGDYISISDDPSLRMGTEDFTIEFWVRIPSLPPVICGLFSKGYYTAGGIDLYFQSNGYLYFDVEQSRLAYNWGANGFAVDTWYHLAITRSGSNVDLWVDGVSVINRTSSVDLNSSANFHLGYTAHYANGWFDDLRITKGIARYTSTFTPPTTAHPTIGVDVKEVGIIAQTIQVD